MAARSKLEGLGHLRILATSIFTPNKAASAAHGGTAVVTLASLRLPSKNREETSESEQAFSNLSQTHGFKDVAVKKMKFDEKTGSNSVLRSLAREVGILAPISHPNIVHLEGFVEDVDNQIAWMVLPWQANGNVREFLASGRWEIPERIWLIFDVMAGIQHLHSRDPPVCHGDLKSLNILVSESYRAIITDFGSARVVKNKGQQREDVMPSVQPPTITESEPLPAHGCSAEALTLEAIETITGPGWSTRWASPEVLKGENPDLASDIWAAGWICWEVMTDHLPFHNITQDARIIYRIVQGELPPIEDETHIAEIRVLSSLMVDCWSSVPAHRPSAERCLGIVEWMPKAIPTDKEAGDEPKIRSAELLLTLGDLAFIQSEWDKAFASYNRAFDLAQAINDARVGWRALNQMGTIHLMQRRLDEALSLFNSLPDAASNGDNDEYLLAVAFSFSQRGNIYMNQGQLEIAQLMLDQSHGAYRLMGLHSARVGLADLLKTRGRLYYKQEKYDMAAEEFQKACTLASMLGDEYGEAEALFGMVETCWNLKRHREVAEYAEAARKLYARVGSDLSNSLPMLASYLGFSLKELGNWPQAILTLDEAVILLRASASARDHKIADACKLQADELRYLIGLFDGPKVMRQTIRLDPTVSNIAVTITEDGIVMEPTSSNETNP